MARTLIAFVLASIALNMASRREIESVRRPPNGQRDYAVLSTVGMYCTSGFVPVSSGVRMLVRMWKPLL